MDVQIIINQYVAALVQANENEKQRIYQEALCKIIEQSQMDINSANEAFRKALDLVEEVRTFVSEPNLSNILGSSKTKHGEIAEMLEVKIGDAYDCMNGTTPRWSMDKDVIGRTGPIDYVFDGIAVQSKFCNGTNNTLNAVLAHLDKYPNFGDEGFYVIPKNHYDTIQKILHGDGVENLNIKSINAINSKLEEIVQKTGKPIEEILQSGRFSYEDVQLGRVDAVLNNEEGRIRIQQKENIEQIHKDTKEKLKTNEETIKPSLQESLKFSLINGAVGGTLEAAQCIYKKIKSGKKIGDFTPTDWKEVGIDFSKGGIKGGISGMGIYWLTKFANCSASIASAMASATIGIGSLALSYQRGKITKDEFIGGAYALSYETSIVTVGAIVGQMAIPVPVLGAMLGSTISKFAYELTKNFYANCENSLIEEMEDKYNRVESKMQKDFSQYANKLSNYYKELNALIIMSEKYDCYALLNSQSLCRKLGIEPLGLDTIDVYMRS